MLSIKNKLNDSFKVAQNFIHTNKPWLIQGVSCLAIASVEAYITYLGLMDNESSIHYKIARTCGAAMKLITLATLVPLSRVAYTHLQNNTFINKHVALDKRILDHKIFSSALIVTALIHTGSHFLNNNYIFRGQSGITGIMMLSSITVLPLAGMVCFNRFGTTLRVHQIGAGMFFIAYLMHTPDYRLLAYTVAASVPFCIDRWIETAYYQYPTNILSANLIADTDFISLELKKPPAFKHYKVGQYAYLSFDSVNTKFEPAHPFTIAELDDEKIKFLIKRVGKWTEKLCNQVMQQQIEPLSGCIAGPFGRTLLNIIFDYSVTFIASGIGITPVMALLDYIIHANQRNLPQPIKLHLIERKLSEVMPVFALINKIDAKKYEAIKSIDVYLTRVNANDVSAKKLTSLSLFAHKTTMHAGRPCIDDVVKSSSVISVCGSKEIVATVNQAASRFGKRCYHETF